jgi:hypothetical protein
MFDFLLIKVFFDKFVHYAQLYFWLFCSNKCFTNNLEQNFEKKYGKIRLVGEKPKAGFFKNPPKIFKRTLLVVLELK